MGYPDWQTESALASLISGALASAGIPVLSSPVLLYDIIATGGAGTPAKVGATTYGPNWDPPVSAAQAITNFNSYVTGNPASVAQKSYMAEGVWPTSVPSGDQAIINAGAELYRSFKPSRVLSVSEQNNLAASLTMYKNAGALLHPILWQECEQAFTNVSQWLAYWAYYQPVVKAAGLPCVFNPGSALPNGTITTLWPTPLPDEAIQDMYWIEYHNNKTFGELITLAGAHGIPVGIGEWNTQGATTIIPTLDQWNAFVNYIISTFSDVMASGNPLSAIMFYDGAHIETKPSEQLVTSTDYKIPALNKLQAALSVAPSNAGIQVAPGHTVVFPPIAPSPNGKYATANGIGYDISLIVNTSAGSTVPFGVLGLKWINSDVANAPAVHTQRWIVPAGAAGTAGTLITGRGPGRAQYLQVNYTNEDTVNEFVQMQLNSTARQADRDDLRWDAIISPAVPTFGLPGGEPYTLQLGSVTTGTITPSNSKSWLFGMFAGRTQLRVVVQGATGQHTVHVQGGPMPSSLFGTVNQFSQYLPAGTNPGDNDQSFELDLARGPYQLTISNGDTASITASAVLVAQET